MLRHDPAHPSRKLGEPHVESVRRNVVSIEAIGPCFGWSWSISRAGTHREQGAVGFWRVSRLCDSCGSAPFFRVQPSPGAGILTGMTTTSNEASAGQPIAKPSGLHHVRLSVSDIERSRAFYTSLLGTEPAIDKTSELSDPGAVDDPERLYGGVVFELGEQILGLRPMPGAAGDRFSPTRVGLDHLSLAVSSRAELDAAAERLSAAGVEHGDVIELTDQGMQILSVQDPDDINLELTAPLS